MTRNRLGCSPRLRGILFDIGDTLIPATDIADCALAETECWLRGIGLLDSEAGFISAYQRADRSTVGPGVNHLFSNLDIAREAMTAIGIGRPKEVAERFLAVYRTSVRERITVNQRLVRFLERIKQAGYRIAAVTDGTTMEQLETLYRLRVLRFFDSAVTSEDVGEEKPHPIVFHTVLRSIGTEPNRALMVGDNLERDIMGASSLGIRTAWVVGCSSTSSESRPCGAADYTIKAVSDLSHVLDLK